jgi:hypothetical protein
VRKHIVKIFLILAAIIMIMPNKAVYAETLEDNLNNLVGSKQ